MESLFNPFQQEESYCHSISHSDKLPNNFSLEFKGKKYKVDNIMKIELPLTTNPSTWNNSVLNLTSISVLAPIASLPQVAKKCLVINSYTFHSSLDRICFSANFTG